MHGGNYIFLYYEIRYYSVRLEYESFGIRYIWYLPASGVHCIKVNHTMAPFQKNAWKKLSRAKYNISVYNKSSFCAQKLYTKIGIVFCSLTSFSMQLYEKGPLHCVIYFYTKEKLIFLTFDYRTSGFLCSFLFWWHIFPIHTILATLIRYFIFIIGHFYWPLDVSIISSCSQKFYVKGFSEADIYLAHIKLFSFFPHLIVD